MTDLSCKYILKLQDELQLLRSENCCLKHSTECLTEVNFQENNAKVSSTLVFPHQDIPPLKGIKICGDYNSIDNVGNQR